MTVNNIGYYPSLLPALGCTINMQCVNYHLGRNPYLGVGSACELCKCVSFADIAARVFGCTSPTAGACISLACLAGKRSWNYKICGWPYEEIGGVCTYAPRVVNMCWTNNNPGCTNWVSPAGWCCGDLMNVCVSSSYSYCAEWPAYPNCCFLTSIVSALGNVCNGVPTNGVANTKINFYNGGRLALYGTTPLKGTTSCLAVNLSVCLGCFTIYNYGLIGAGGAGGAGYCVCFTALLAAGKAIYIRAEGGAGSLGGWSQTSCGSGRGLNRHPWGVNGSPGCCLNCNCIPVGTTTCCQLINFGGGDAGGNLDCLGTRSNLVYGTYGPTLTNEAICVNCGTAGCGGVGLDSGAGGVVLFSRGVPAGCQCIKAGSAYAFGDSFHLFYGGALSLGAQGYPGTCAWAQVGGGGGGMPGTSFGARHSGNAAVGAGGTYYGASYSLRCSAGNLPHRVISGNYTYAPQSTGCLVGL